jgi:LPXTG-site transpeptidase (sortase) family protein
MSANSTRRWPQALAGIVSAGACAALISACSAPAAIPGAAALPSRPTVAASAAAGSGAERSVSISTPVPPSDQLDDAPDVGVDAPPARAGQAGVNQRHAFAPTSITLSLRDADGGTAAITTIDTTPSGELSLPPDPGQVGWWQSGALAGDVFGSVVLAGHIDSRDHGVGFFARLLTVHPGDEVELSNSAYRLRYRVVSTREVPKASLATSTDTFSQAVAGRLVLLTCTGPYDPRTHYPDNLVVIAEPLGVAEPRG